MAEIDLVILAFLNQFARTWPVLDQAMVLCTTNDLIKGGVLVTALTWVWWSRGAHTACGARRRLLVLGALVASVGAVLVARLISTVLPFRTRPLLDPDLGFVPPFGTESVGLERWSAFPSDHATLYVALAVTLFFVSRRLGSVAMLYALLVDGVARVYVGAHHPTDVLAGALLGVVAGVVAAKAMPRLAILQRALAWSCSHPQVAQPLLFLALFQVATVFDGTRAIGRFAFEMARAMLTGTFASA